MRRGGIALTIYEHSLSLTCSCSSRLAGLHAYGRAEYSEEQLAHGGAAVSTSPTRHCALLVESFQNWQSEFLSVGALFVLTIFLRERGSAQSKPVAAPHSETGS